MGVANYFLGRFQKAIEFHEQALNIYRKLGFKEGVGLTLGNLGLAYSSLGEYQKAIKLYRESLVIARELGDRLREGNALNNIGEAYIRQGQYVNISAGTPSVIVSLWSVPDAPTAELMTNFYTNLYKKKLDKAQAY